ncbi:MAG: DUF4912 domain-containing protein [Clostridia bacterium]|nr:DUF4912 domain-containing protein [Clostridia bacterium]
MPKLTNDNKTKNKTKKNNTIKETRKTTDNIKKKTTSKKTTTNSVSPKNNAKNNQVNKNDKLNKESFASKTVKEARRKVAKEVKENLKNDLKQTEAKKLKDKKIKEENLIKRIKRFISNIIVMQEEELNKKELQDSIKGNLEERKINKNKKDKYILEYYDLPYRYNETVVKILAQTPKRLFVYWDISDNDIIKFKKSYGNNFFEETYPVLFVHNLEKNYTFEVEINDFANSWYLDISDSKSTYVIQLGRKFKDNLNFVNITESSNVEKLDPNNNYVAITTSNFLEVPNDHILFENVGDKALYRNIKTNEENYINISNSNFMKKIGKIYSIYDLYKEIYKNELGDGSLTDLLNPSSMSTSSTSASMFK